MQTQKNSNPCQIISYSEAKRERDERKEAELKLAEETEKVERQLLEAIFTKDFEALVNGV